MAERSGLSRSTIGRIWRDFGLKPHRTDTFKLSTDPLLRAVVATAWQLRLLPASPQLFDAALKLPIMDVTRARVELGWSPRYSALDVIREFLDGLRQGAGMGTPPLALQRADHGGCGSS